ncbi:EAL domain-containing protein [Bacillus pinisoli]|uniref:EAL domain-containing protein n=1 Tax=Bacillus pinisoli TaxID=2901866 RepID=UPI001FF6C5F3|nr:EAL domain-containing protein [Bacillus pinisoli]
MSCTQCTDVNMYENEGFIIMFSRFPEIIRAILPAIDPTNIRSSEATTCTVEYHSIEQLLQTFEAIHTIVEEQFGSKIELYTSIEDKQQQQARFPQMLPFAEIYSRVKQPKLFHVIKESYFTNHIQPIISLKDDKIVGYEFLLRSSHPEFPFTPYELFTFSQSAGLQAMLDGNARKQAIKYGSENLTKGMLRFINFLPSSIYNPKHCLQSTFENIEKYNVDPSDLVFEVVETEKIHDVSHLQAIFEAYKHEGINVALDDIGAGYSTIELLEELRPNYAKIDRELISFCDQSTDKLDRLKRIIEVAKAYDIKTLAEGIERREELELCRALGYDFAQGYYIGKPSPKPLTLVELP